MVDDSSNNLSKIEFKNQSINSSIRSLSRGEEYIQKDILQFLNGQPTVSKLNSFIFLFRKKMEIMTVLLKIMLIIKLLKYLWKIHFKVREAKTLF